MITVSLRATATAAIWDPRHADTLWKKARSGPGPRTTCHAAFTGMVRTRAALLCDAPVPLCSAAIWMIGHRQSG